VGHEENVPDHCRNQSSGLQPLVCEPRTAQYETEDSLISCWWGNMGRLHYSYINIQYITQCTHKLLCGLGNSGKI